MSEGFNVALQFDLEFGRSMIMTLDSLDHEGEASACLRLVDWHDWPEVARLRDAAQEAIDLIYSKYGANRREATSVYLPDGDSSLGVYLCFCQRASHCPHEWS